VSSREGLASTALPPTADGDTGHTNAVDRPAAAERGTLSRQRDRECMLSGRIDPLASRCLAVLPAVIASLLAVQAVGQTLTRGGITGNVQSGADRLSGVRVTVVKPDLTRSVVADAAGHFDLSDLPEGSYTVTAELVGFDASHQQNVMVRPGRTSIVNLTLRIACLRVVWTRADVPTLTDGMPVEDFLGALRALLPNSRP